MVNGPTAKAHAACEREHPDFDSCWGSDFENGENEQIN